MLMIFKWHPEVNYLVNLKCFISYVDNLIPNYWLYIYIYMTTSMKNASITDIMRVNRYRVSTIINKWEFTLQWSKKTSKLHVIGLCAGNSPVTGEFLTKMASNAENVYIWWRHHVYWLNLVTNAPQYVRHFGVKITTLGSLESYFPSTSLLRSNIAYYVLFSRCLYI